MKRQRLRQSITFTEPGLKWLKARAKVLGISLSDVIRRLIDEKREKEDA